MKKLFFALFLFTTLLSCQKDVDPPESTKIAQAIKTCFVEKGLPTLAKKGDYIEGEIDNKYFLLSTTGNYSVGNSVSGLFSNGYDSVYGLTNSYVGANFGARYVVAFTSTKPTTKFSLDIYFPDFNGDSIAFSNYFNQFQKGKNFKFITNGNDFKSRKEPLTVTMIVSTFDCVPALTKKSDISTTETSQVDSYFRVTDVKENKDASGQITKRDVTIEFDVKLGAEATLRIKNGRLQFSY